MTSSWPSGSPAIGATAELSRTISPDDTARGAKAAGCGGDPDLARARDCGYAAIISIGLSPRDNDTIWLGFEDGRVKVTRLP